MNIDRITFDNFRLKYQEVRLNPQYNMASRANELCRGATSLERWLHMPSIAKRNNVYVRPPPLMSLPWNSLLLCLHFLSEMILATLSFMHSVRPSLPLIYQHFIRWRFNKFQDYEYMFQMEKQQQTHARSVTKWPRKTNDTQLL